MKRTSAIFLVLTCMFSTTQAQNKPLHVINTFHIASGGGWDYLAVSPVNDWLYLSHGTQVNVLNKNTGDSVGVIMNTPGVHGIAFDAADKKGFTSNGRLNTVTVFDMENNNVLGQVPTGTGPDAIMFESYSKKIITCNGRSKNLSIIDPQQNKLIDSVDIGGRPEEAASDGAGHLYVNLEDKNQIAVVDTKTFKVTDHWSLLPGKGPTGIAIDPITKRIFAGCEKMLMIIDATNGKLTDSIPIGEGCDGVAFDPASKNIYTSNGSGTISVIHEDNANAFTKLKDIETKRGARTIALDKNTHKIYLPTADFEPMDPNQKGRPKMIPGTFQVLVVGQ